MLPHGEVMVVFTDYVKYILCHLLQFSVEIQSISKVKRTVQCLFVLAIQSFVSFWLVIYKNFCHLHKAYIKKFIEILTLSINILQSKINRLLCNYKIPHYLALLFAEVGREVSIYLSISLMGLLLLRF